MSKVKCNLSEEALWKRIDKVLHKLERENPKYLATQEENNRLSKKITEIVVQQLAEIPGRMLMLELEEVQLDLSCFWLEAAYIEGYKDAMKSLRTEAIGA